MPFITPKTFGNVKQMNIHDSGKLFYLFVFYYPVFLEGFI